MHKDRRRSIGVVRVEAARLANLSWLPVSGTVGRD